MSVTIVRYLVKFQLRNIKYSICITTVDYYDITYLDIVVYKRVSLKICSSLIATHIYTVNRTVAAPLQDKWDDS